MHLHRLVVLLLTSGSVVAIAAAQNAQEASSWESYSFPQSRFAAQFPVKPTTETRSGASTVYVAVKEGVEFRVTVTEGAAQDAIARSEARLTSGASVHSAVDARIDRQFGREFSYSSPTGARSVAAIFVVEGRLIESVGTAPPALALQRSGDLLRFQQSLTFIDASGAEPRRGPPGGGGGGGGGQGGRGGRGGPGGPGGPEGLRGPNAAGFEACQGHKDGDAVSLQTPEGTVTARCVLVARPDRPSPR